MARAGLLDVGDRDERENLGELVSHSKHPTGSRTPPSLFGLIPDGAGLHAAASGGHAAGRARRAFPLADRRGGRWKCEDAEQARRRGSCMMQRQATRRALVWGCRGARLCELQRTSGRLSVFEGGRRRCRAYHQDRHGRRRLAKLGVRLVPETKNVARGERRLRGRKVGSVISVSAEGRSLAVWGGQRSERRDRGAATNLDQEGMVI